MILYPNAKINVGLNIIRKRNDNYHDIESIFLPFFKCFDILEILPSDHFSFVSSGNSVSNENNICVQAFNLLKRDFKIPNVSIHLHKMIPIGAGLGGGSSDGAFTLIAINKIFKLNISNKSLEKYALELGADCPFFIDNTPKYVEGVGELMTKINIDSSDFEIEIINPNIHISTAEAYNSIIPREPKYNLREIVDIPIDKWKNQVINDFEKPIFHQYPDLEGYKKSFYKKGALYSSMTGSGSVIYGLFKSNKS